MGFGAIKKKAHSLFDTAGFICHIRNEKEYETAVALMDDLIEDYDQYRPLIEILSLSIERWENESKAFKIFNAQIKALNAGTSVLKILMDQYDLGIADFPEIGSKYLVSKILNNQRRLTLDHIQALCKRFGIQPMLFFK